MVSTETPVGPAEDALKISSLPTPLKRAPTRKQKTKLTFPGLPEEHDSRGDIKEVVGLSFQKHFLEGDSQVNHVQ